MRTLSTVTALVLMATIGQAALADEMETIALVERATTDTVIDLGATGDSAGDMLTFANEIFDQANEKLVGTNNGLCVRTLAGKAWECAFSTTLEKGQITVEGPFYDGKDSILAVTGGTGAYVDARGEMKLHARNDKGTEYDFVFTLSH